jgi:hypothetical protein
MEGRTIDNLGYSASQRYARDQKLLDDQGALPQDAKLIYSKTSIDVTEPIFEKQQDPSFQTTLKNSCWADFAPPSSFDRPKKLFTYELLPSFGGKEKLEALKQLIFDAYPEEIDEDPSLTKEEKWELGQEKEKLEKEKQALTALLSCILHLDNCMIYVHAKRAQYHKG